MSITNHTALIIDDETNNIALLEHFVSKYCLDIKVVGHALTVQDAIAKIKSKRPDILFLDIKLNEGDAFDILDSLKEVKAQIIFVTSYNEYALKAFKYNAIDYILKPIIIEDLVVAVNKAVKNIEQKRFFDFQKVQALKPQKEAPENKNYIAISYPDRIDMLKANDVIYIEAINRYAVFHTRDGKKHVSSKNLRYFEEILDDTVFFRTHNTHIININHLVKIVKTGGSYCEMDTGLLLPISKRKQEEFNKFLKIKN